MKRLILSIIALVVSASPLAASVRYVQLTPANDVISLDPTDIVEILACNYSRFRPQFTFVGGHQFEPSGNQIISHIYTGIVAVESRNSAMTLKLTGKEDVAENYVTLLPGASLPLHSSDLIQIVGAQPDSARTHQITFQDGSQHEDIAANSMSQIFTNVARFKSGSSLTSLKVTPQGTETAAEKNTANISALEERIATTEADVSKNVTAIAENGTGIAVNVSSIATNANAIADHEGRINQNITNISTNGGDTLTNANAIADHENRINQNITNISTNGGDTLTNANAIADHENRINQNITNISTNGVDTLTNANAITDHENRITQNRDIGLETAADIAANSTTIQDNATGIAANGIAIAGNGTSIQDIATTIEKIGTSVQDNATSIATSGAAIAENGTAIAGNGTSIQEIATGVAAIGTSVQDNATGIATNASAITSNASSIATNATTIAGNATSTETNSGAITQINLTLQANQNERGRNALEIGQNQLRFQALENQIGSLGSDAAFIQKLGDEFATKADLTTAISEGKTQGINAVTSDPNNWNIFTADQIQEMAVGDLVLTREENGDFVLNYEIQQSDNAKDWTTYSAQAETITGLPVNKAFVRIRTR